MSSIRIRRPSSRLKSLLVSPVSHLLWTNSRPSDHEIELVLKAIWAVKEELLRLQKDVNDNPGNATVLKWETSACEKYISAHQALLSPIRKLPPEILSEIFSLCVAVNGAPWLSCHVCCHWRNITRATSSLWTTVPQITLSKKTRRPGFTSVLEDYLLLSCKYPLCLRVITLFTEIEFLSHPALDIVMKHSQRWGHVSLSLGDTYLQEMSSRIKGRLSSLSILRLTVHHTSRRLTKLDVFATTPQLREVELDSSSAFVILPWSQLTKYHEEGITYAGIREILAVKSPLVHLTFKQSLYDSAMTQKPADKSTLDQVECLHLVFRSIEDSILDHITLPALMHAQIRLLNYTGSITTSMEMLLRRSSCDLRTLSLHTFLQTGELNRIIALTPNLLELNVDDIPLLDLTSFRGNIKPVVPHLQKLTIHMHQIMPNYPRLYQVLNEVLSLRCNSQSSGSEYGSFDYLSLARIHFSSNLNCIIAQSLLEGWHSDDLNDVIFVYRRCRSYLETILSVYETNIKSSKLKQGAPAFGSGTLRRLDSLFTDIETHEFDNARCLYVSNLKKIGSCK